MSPTYLQWNELIFKKIFDEGNTGRAVSVFVDGQLLNEWGEALGAGRLEGEEGSIMFAAACKRFLTDKPEEIAKRIGNMARDWKQERFPVETPPKFIGLLALLVLASTWGGERHQANMYYGRYWEMMGQPHTHSMIPEIFKIRHAWDALQEWTQSNDGARGLFKVRTLAPAFKNYGIIIAQSLLRPSDEMELRTMFYEFGADRELEYPNSTLLAWFSEKRDKFSSRARAAFDSDANRDLFFERVRQELETWDGEPADVGDLVGRSRSLKKHVFLCLVNHPEPCFTIRADLSSRGGDSDVLEYKEKKTGKPINLKAFSDGSALSLPLKQTFPNDGINKQKQDEIYFIKTESELSHFLSSVLPSSRQGSRDTYRPTGGDIKVFAKIPSVSLTDYVEVNAIHRNVKHVLMVSIHHPDLIRIEEWAKKFAVSEVESAKYTPTFLKNSKWKLIFLGDSIREISDAKLPQLCFERKKIAKLSGGLRFYGAGNKYLKDCPPRLVFETIYPVQLKIGTTSVNITDITKEYDFSPLLNLGLNQLEIMELVPDGVVPETAEIQLSIHEHAEWTPEGKGQWQHGHSQTLITLPKVILVGCRTGEMLPIEKSSNLSPTWSIHSSVTEGKIAMPCTNLFACKNRIKMQISVRFLREDGRTPPPPDLLLWLRTLREAKLHSIAAKNSESKQMWTDLHKALDEEIQLR
jgi:hypothetical protein